MTKLELGSGQSPTPGYMHQDITKFDKIHYVCKPYEVPLIHNTLEEVIAVGVMEHLTKEDFIKTINHIYNLLKQGGEFLFDVPDFKVWIKYLSNWYGYSEGSIPFDFEHLMSTIYGWQRWEGDEHKWGWTEETIVDTLKEKTKFKKAESISNTADIFISKNIKRNRFKRYKTDAHLYVCLKK